MKREYLLTGGEMASCDARTSNMIGIPSLVLMERAALSVADGVDVFLCGKFSPERCGRRPLVLAAAGRGNNGADALAAGRILLDRGYEVRFLRLSGKVSPESSFAVQENILRQYGVYVQEYPTSFFYDLMSKQNESPDSVSASAAGGQGGSSFLETPCGKMQIPDVIIDGLFGTGLSRELSGEAADCVESINRCRDLYGTYVTAVDIPSGISSDDGRVMGCAVRCDETRTFAFYKRGHFMYPGTVFAGDCHLAQIGITQRAFEKEPGMFTLMNAHAEDLLPARDRGGNKGTFGKVLIVAGRRNMCGAALLAAHACMTSGAGMVKIFTHEANRLIIQQSLPEALLDTFTDEDTPEQAAQRLIASLDWADITAAGPAMGIDETAKALLRRILDYVQENGSAEDSKKSPGKSLRGLVFDADAIRLLAGDSRLRELLANRRSGLACILTPHMAEFAALAGLSVRECIAGRTAVVQEQADRLRSTIACKDARTLVAQPLQKENGERLYLNCTGNSGMSTAGSGDVLTGITAAFLAQDFRGAAVSSSFCSGLVFTESEYGSGFAAAVSAVCMHGRAGDLAKEVHGEQGMKAGDLITELARASFWKK